MAKSIRSKRGRKLRNIKRQRYAVKELKKLKDMLGINDDNATSADVDMALSNVANVVDSRSIHGTDTNIKGKKEEIITEEDVRGFFYTAKGEAVKESDDSESDEEMEPVIAVNLTGGETEMDHSQKRVYNKKTMKDQFGNYPPWFKTKDIKKMQQKEKIKKKMQRIQERKIAKKPRRKFRKRRKQEKVSEIGE